MNDLLTIGDAAAALRRGEVSSVELTTRAVAVADAVDAGLGAFLDRFVDTALAAAADADEARAAGIDLGPLHGIPLGVKDIITTREAPTTAQSLVLDPAWGRGDAVSVARLRAAGAVIMGKTTLCEFALGMPDPTKPFPVPVNPWNADHWAGGSSSGSASAVSVGAVYGALGTDTGGSIRIPSAFCGITGLKPTFGRVPKSGCVPLGFSLDHIGPMARSARDCALLLTALAGPDPSDPSSVDEPVPNYLAGLTGDLTGLRIGVDRLARSTGDAEAPELPRVFDAAVATLESLGAQVVELEVPAYAELTAAAVIIMICEAFAYHLPDLQKRWSDYFSSTRRLIASGAFYTGGDYVQAQRVRRMGQTMLAATFTQVDLIATPTCSAGATSLREMEEMVRGFVGGSGSINTQYWDATGSPVISVPMGLGDDGLPLGLQLAGRPFDEATVLRAGDAYQRATDWHRQPPPRATPPRAPAGR